MTTWRYDLTHAGQNTTETALTPQNVNANTFGKLFALKVDSTVYPQPLYMPNLTMGDGLQHNVVFVGTSNDSVYAFDADSNGGANANPIWHVSLLDTAHGAAAGATAVDWHDTGSPDVAPTVGIVGTPAIDPATNTMYVVANSKENGQYFSRLHALNILTGAEKVPPVNVTATVAGTGNGSSGGQLTFSPLWQNQRTAINFYNGYIYFGYAAHGDLGNWHGWLFAYNASTLQQTAVLCLSPNGYGAGLWASGAGMPIDTATGKMFVSTGNGTHTAYPGFNANSAYGEGVFAFSLNNGQITPVDGFTSYTFQTMNNADLDQGSGGVLMVPDQQGANPHMLVTAGKEGRILVLNRDHLGGDNYNGSSNAGIALQDIPPGPAPPKGTTCTSQFPLPQGCGLWSTPAYWNGHVYIWGNGQTAMMFNINSGVMDVEPDSRSQFTSAFPGPSFSISSNGAQDGIAWAVRSDQFNSHGPAVLYAWNAADLSSTIYESDTNAQRDAAGAANKFSIPVITNGKVYVAANGEVDVYGLLDGAVAAAAPTVTPNGGTFASTQTVTLASATASAQIFYTLDGTTPTTASTLYTGPITISTYTTLKAIASAPSYLQSGVTTAAFKFTNQTAPVTFSPAPGTYATAQNVILSDADANAKIYYTVDGTTPTAASTLYTGPVHVGATEKLQAIAIDPALTNSNVAEGSYVIQASGTVIDFNQGFSSVAGLSLNGNAKASNDTRLQLTDGGQGEASSVFWNTPIDVQAFSTNFEFQLSNAVNGGNGFTFTIQNQSPGALGGESAGLGYQGIPNSIAVKFNFYNFQNEGSDSTGLYVNGAAPVNPTVDISPSGIQLNSDDGIIATLNYDGTTLTLNLKDTTNGKTFTYSWPIDIPKTIGSNTAYVGFTGGSGGLSSSQKIMTWYYATAAVNPAFSPAPGNYTAAQNVTLTSTTSDAQIFYTLDGSTPTGNSTLYSKPIAVTQSEKISAIAISPNYGASVVAQGQYNIGANTGGTGSFSLGGSKIADIQAGGTGNSAITITPASGFTGNVALTCAVTGTSGTANLPTCSITQPAAISGTQTVNANLTITTSANTPAGAYSVVVTGTSGTLNTTATVGFNVIGGTPAPTFALSGTAVTVAALGTPATSTITITPNGGFTGTVTLACAVSGASGATAPTCTVTQPAAIAGTQAVTATLTINSQSSTTAGAYTATVTGTAAGLTETASVSVTVNAASATPGFALTGTAVSVSTPGTPATATITVTPSGGFTGAVALSCAVTASPAGANAPPTCSVTQPAAISGTQAVTATLTINTTAAATAALHNPLGNILSVGGGGTLAALILFCMPIRRRKWQAFFGLMLLGILVSAASGCGGGSNSISTRAGTTAGSYTITVTGTAGTTQNTTTVSVNVQ